VVFDSFSALSNISWAENVNFFYYYSGPRGLRSFFFFFSPSTKFPDTISYPVTRVFKVALPTFDDSMIYLLYNCVRHPNLEIFDIRGAPF